MFFFQIYVSHFYPSIRTGTHLLNIWRTSFGSNLQLDESAGAPSSRDAPSFSACDALAFDSVRVVGDEAPRPKQDKKRQKNDGHSGRQDPSDPLYN